MCSQAYHACVLSCFNCVQLWATLQVAWPSPGDLPYPGIEPAPLTSLTLAGGFFTISITWEATRLSCVNEDGRRSMDCSISPSCTTHISLLIPSLLRHLLICWPFSMSLSISGVIKSLREWLTVRRQVESPLYRIQNQCVKLPQSVVLTRITLICFWSRCTLVRDYCFLHGTFYLNATPVPRPPRLPSRPAFSSSLQARRQVHSKTRSQGSDIIFLPWEFAHLFSTKSKSFGGQKKKKIFKISLCLYISGKVVIPPRRDAEPWASDLGFHQRTCLPAASLSLLASAFSSPAESLLWAPPRGWKRQDRRRNRLIEVPADQIGEAGEMRGEVKASTGALLT